MRACVRVCMCVCVCACVCVLVILILLVFACMLAVQSHKPHDWRARLFTNHHSLVCYTCVYVHLLLQLFHVFQFLSKLPLCWCLDKGHNVVLLVKKKTRLPSTRFFVYYLSFCLLERCLFVYNCCLTSCPEVMFGSCDTITIRRSTKLYIVDKLSTLPCLSSVTSPSILLKRSW